MDSHIKIASLLVYLLDNKFKIFGLRFGIDPILGLIPGFGDVAGLLLSIYVIWIAVRMRLPSYKINKMITNILIDFLLGIVPIAGDIADFVFKANYRNLKIIEEHHKNFINGTIR